MKVYTKTGDDGYTRLLNGERVSKEDVRIELLGSMDELTSHLGLIRVMLQEEQISHHIKEIQELLIAFMADIAEGKAISSRIDHSVLVSLEALIDSYSIFINTPLKNGFSLPGSNKASAYIDVARTIARSVERKMIAVDKKYPIDSTEKIYMNRLSDFLYVSARYIELKEHIVEKVTSILRETYKIEGRTDGKDKKKITLQYAKKIMDSVHAKAQSMNLNAAVAIMDEAGNYVAVQSMEGTLPVSFDVAMKKAYTAISLKMTTEELGKLVQPGETFYGLQSIDNRIVTFGGGSPLKVNGEIIGAIGVSGGTGEQDVEIMESGIQMFLELMK